MSEGEGAAERYRRLRQIGAGGMGVVWEVEDRERGQRVALKTIADPDIEQIYRLKREFRVLADLGHPNLVSLYDLVVDGEACFFTMELLDGTDLLSHVWGRPAFESAALDHTATHSVDVPAPAELSAFARTEDSASQPTPCRIDHLRAALPQLARGLHTLHLAGKVHRDVKPSNVQVTAEGRVVILDFGLATEIERPRSSVPGVVGTVPYLAPEQCSGDAVIAPAADWYAVGVVLFQALTGRLPFEGPMARVLYDKQTKVAPRASRLATNIPKDLDDLCAELLEREPSDRPSGPALFARLGATELVNREAASTTGSLDIRFAGRDAELAALDRALEPLTRKRASIAVVRATSGQGKTSLVSRFLERVEARVENALVLRGRCLDREDVPYKAIDPLIDELSDWWLALSPTEAQALLPRDAHLLPTLFPVLDRVPAIADAPRSRTIADPQARRTHAFDALRETLQRLGDRYTVVLFLDDMQWVDRDTQTLLADLLRAPDPPSVLLVLAARADGSEPIVQLAHKLDADVSVIDVGPLSDDAARALALAHLGADRVDIVERLVREAEGSPLFLIEMTRHLRGHSVEELAGKGLDAILAERIASLGEVARLLAEVVAVGGEPLERGILVQATGVPPAEISRHLSVLRAEHVVRVSGSRSYDTVEPYHARVRAAVLAGLAPERRAKHHRALALAFSGKGSAEQLARHWYGAGDLEHAAQHARRAGDDARAKLAFDLSARWYAMALEDPRWTEVERRALATQLADALADAGRPRDAADQFLAASTGAETTTSLELRRRAAGVLLQSGYVTEGLALTRDVLADVGLKMARTPIRALFAMLFKRAWLRIRGLSFRSRSHGEISQLELTRVDVCEGVAFGLSLVDTFRAMDFGARFLLSALRLGEPYRVARALALEADYLAATAQRGRAKRLLSRLADLSATIDEPAASPQLAATHAFLDFFLDNKFRRAYDGFTSAIDEYRALVGRAGFELDTVSMFACWALYYLGDLGELSRRVPAMAEAAVRSGNRYTAVTLKCAFPIAWLARLEPDTVEAELDAALASWATPEVGYQLQHMFGLCSRVDLAMYRGTPETVSAQVDAELPLVRRALLDRTPLQALLARSTFARHALAIAARTEGDARRDAITRARKHVRAFRKLPIPIMAPCATMFDGAFAEIAGDLDTAVAHYRAALPRLESTDMFLYAHVVRDRLGTLVGGSEGAELRATTATWLAREGVREPDRMLAMLLPRPSSM